MLRKAKYTVEAKIKAAERYLRGEASARETVTELGMPESGRIKVRDWEAIYRKNGVEGFPS